MGFCGNLTAIYKCSTLNRIGDHRISGGGATREFGKQRRKRAAASAALSSVGLLFQRTYCGACTRIRFAVTVKVPLMLGMGLPFRS